MYQKGKSNATSGPFDDVSLNDSLTKWNKWLALKEDDDLNSVYVSV